MITLLYGIRLAKKMYKVKRTIRYMGNKIKLLDFIIPEIIKYTKKDEIVCELMAGTNSVMYALKEKRCVYTNDIQYYSYIIANALIKNNSETISSKKAILELYNNYELNRKMKYFNFFVKNYSDTYFSFGQCEEIDSIRYAIEKVNNNDRKCLYLVSLMYAMCICQSTSGHFAQYLPSDNPRLKSIREKSIFDVFLKKCDDFQDIVFNKYDNKCFNKNYIDLINEKWFDKVSLVYIDPPYTTEQYSRFYHVLETVCKYDNPNLEYKGLYRTDRFNSPFSLRTQAFKEFDKLLSVLSNKNKKIVISYSTKGIVKEYELEYLIKKYFKNCKIKKTSYKHSTQGKGNIKIEELLFIAYN